MDAARGSIADDILDETVEAIVAERAFRSKFIPGIQQALEEARATMLELCGNAGQTVIVQEYAFEGIEDWEKEILDIAERDTYEALNYGFDYYTWKQTIEEACEGSPKADAIEIIIDEGYMVLYKVLEELRQLALAYQLAVEAAVGLFRNFMDRLNDNANRTPETIAARIHYMSMVKYYQTPAGKAVLLQRRTELINRILANPRKRVPGYDFYGDLAAGRPTGVYAIDRFVNAGRYRASMPNSAERRRQNYATISNIRKGLTSDTKVWRWNGYKDVLVDYGTVGQIRKRR